MKYGPGDRVRVRHTGVVAKVLEVDARERLLLDLEDGRQWVSPRTVAPASVVAAPRGARGFEPRALELEAMALFEQGLSYRLIGEKLRISSERARDYVGNVHAYRSSRRAAG